MNQLKTDSTQLDVVNQSIKPPAENETSMLGKSGCSWGSWGTEHLNHQPNPTKSGHFLDYGSKMHPSAILSGTT